VLEAGANGTPEANGMLEANGKPEPNGAKSPGTYPPGEEPRPREGEPTGSAHGELL
jgi:hypothetical protein